MGPLQDAYTAMGANEQFVPVLAGRRHGARSHGGLRGERPSRCLFRCLRRDLAMAISARCQSRERC